MFEYLSHLGNQIVGRYKTLENTIKCRSNSFYDSYLDLLEQTIKTILVNEEVALYWALFVTHGRIINVPIRYVKGSMDIEFYAFFLVSVNK